MIDFGKRFKNLRIARGFSQDDMAKALHCSRSRIGMYETGKREPDFEMLETIADFFNIDIAYLMRGAKEEEPSYYYDEEAKQAAEFLHKNPMYKVLFDASRKVKPEDIDFVKKMIDRMTGDNVDDTGC